MASQEMEMLKVQMKMMLEKGFAPKFDGSIDPIQLRNTVQMAQAHMPVEPNVVFKEEILGGIECEQSIPDGAREDAIIFYIHGGGLICGNAQTSRGYASLLAGESKIPVYSCTYRLAPEHKFPAGLEDCYSVYKALLEKYPDKAIFLIGESGGGYLSIVTALKARDEGIILPTAIVPYSPPIDFSNAIDRDFEGNKDFTVLPEGLNQLGSWYIDKAERKNPYVSPYYADFKDMCPMLLAWDESESLAKDSEILRDKAIEAGVEVTWKSYPDCFHAFATTGRGTPESYEILNDTVSFFNKFL